MSWVQAVTNHLRMPTEDELAEMSHSELHECIRVAFYQWQEMRRLGEDTVERKHIFYAYDNELLKRLKRLKKYLNWWTDLSVFTFAALKRIFL